MTTDTRVRDLNIARTLATADWHELKAADCANREDLPTARWHRNRASLLRS